MDRDFPRAFAKSQAAAGSALPESGTVFISVADRDKREIVLPARRLVEMGYKILATQGTQVALARNGIESKTVRKYSQRDLPEPSIVELIASGEVDMVINTPGGQSERQDGYEIRAATVTADKPIFTTASELAAAVAALSVKDQPFEVKSLQQYELERRAKEQQ